MPKPAGEGGFVASFILRSIALWVAGLILSVAASAQPAPLVIGGQSTAPGTRQDFSISVAAAEDPATHIPVTVIHSGRPGPVILVVAGVHGYEFAPILAVKQLAESLSPSSIKGSLILVRAAHVSAFEERSPYVNPFDRKNLNRSFPGDPEGSQTERIAHHLSKDLIQQADIVIDVHSGDGAEWLEPFVGIYGGPLATGYPLTLAAAKASGLQNIVTYVMNTQAQVDRGRSLNRQAVADKRPTLLLEAGQNGGRDPKMIALLRRAITNIMVTLDLLSAAHQTQAADTIYEFAGTYSIPAPASGIWTPAITRGQFLKAGQTLGRLFDYFGNEVAVITAPRAGYALYGLAGPPVKQGQALITIANQKEAD